MDTVTAKAPKITFSVEFDDYIATYTWKCPSDYKMDIYISEEELFPSPISYITITGKVNRSYKKIK